MDAWRSSKTKNCVATVTPVGEGKSWFGAHWLVAEAASIPDVWHLATANTFAQLGDVVLPNLVKACEDYGIDCEHRGQYQGQHDVLLVHLKSGPVRTLLRATQKRSAVEKLRGIEIGRWWQDEARDSDLYAFNVISARLRDPAAPNHRSLHTTTPNGFDWIYDLFVERPHADRKIVHVTERGNWRLPAGYDDRLRATYDEDMARQELQAGFVSLGQGALYPMFDRGQNVTDAADYDPNLPALLCWDFGAANSMACVIAQQKSRCLIDIVDEVVIKRGNTPMTCDALQYMMGAQGRQHSAGYVVYGDAYGHGGTAGLSDYQAIEQHMQQWAGCSVDFDTRRSNPDVVNRVNSVNGALRRANGDVELRVHTRCTKTIRDLERVKAKPKTRKPDKSDPDLTHTSDAVGYMTVIRMPVERFNREHEEMEAAPW